MGGSVSRESVLTDRQLEGTAVSAQASVSLGMDEPEENVCFPTPGGSWESDQSIVQKRFPFLATASQFKPHTSSLL